MAGGRLERDLCERRGGKTKAATRLKDVLCRTGDESKMETRSKSRRGSRHGVGRVSAGARGGSGMNAPFGAAQGYYNAESRPRPPFR